MKAAVLYGPHDWRIEEVSEPATEKNECLLDIKACGVCHSEIHQWDTKIPGLEYPRLIGHEVAGIITQIGESVTGFKIGDRVAAWTDGRGYAEQISLKSETLVKIAEHIPYEYALAEPIACTTNAVMRADIQINDTIALVGTGFMGLIMLQELKLVGAKKIIAIDLREEVLDIARDLGADVYLNPQKEDVSSIIKELTYGAGVDISIEAGGSQSTLDLAASICRMEGKLMIFGYHPGQRLIKDLGYWNWMAFNIINAHFRDINTIMKGTRIGMDLLNSDKIKMDRLITHRYDLNDIEKAFIAAKEKPESFIKSVIVN